MPNYTMQVSEQSKIKFEKLEQFVSVLSNEEYRRFECAVFNLVENTSVFSEVELLDLKTKSDLKIIPSSCMDTVLQ